MAKTDTMRTIEAVKPAGEARLQLRWSDGTQAEIDLSAWLATPAFAALRDPAEFAKVKLGDWGHSLEWPNGVEAGADSLWLETLTATRSEGARAFLEWRLKHALSLTAAAEALGLSRRMVAYYSNGEKPVPKTVMLACRDGRRGARCRRSLLERRKTHILSSYSLVSPHQPRSSRFRAAERTATLDSRGSHSAIEAWA
jgi:hypothetical protein